MNLGVYLAMCEPDVPLFLVEIMPSSGVAVVPRDWWAQLAYGWVEHCSDIASCGEASSQDKYFLVYLISATVFACFMNYEHVECLNEWSLLPLCNCIVMHLCMYFMFNAFYIMYTGLDFPFESINIVGLVLSIVGMRGGEGTWQKLHIPCHWFVK